MNNFISTTESKELTYISSSSNVEKFDVFLQDGRHEVPSQVASNAFTQNIEDCRTHANAKP